MTSNPRQARNPSISTYWRERFGERVHRVCVDAGFSCPNREEALGKKGCAFCDPASFSPSIGDRRPVAEQIARGISRLEQKGIHRFAAYFQPHTNTHAPLEELRRAFDAVLPFPQVVALCIGTRPDCVGEPVLDLLSSYSERFEVWLELGLQSAKDETLSRIDRGHSAQDFADACERARERGLLVCAHVILGLPGEDSADEAHTAGFLADLEVEGVKLHHLAVVRGTPLEALWRKGEVEVLSEFQYADRAVAFIQRLSPRTVLHRLVGDTSMEHLLAPHYDKARVVQAIRAGLERLRPWRVYQR